MLRLLAIVVGTCAALPALAATGPWQEIAPGVKARLISSDRVVEGRSMAGFEIDLPEGTKTYWRVPGEVGIPTELDFSASSGVLDPVVHWPFPLIERGQGYLDYVYRGNLVLPFEFGVADAGATLDVSVVMGICSDMCVPATARFSLSLAGAAPDDAQSIRLDQAMAETPILWDLRSAPMSGLTLGPGGSLFIEMPSPRIDPDRLIVEVGDPAILFETPQKSPDGTLWTLKPLGGAVNKELEGSSVQLTFQTPNGPYAVTRTLLSSDPA